MKYPELNNHTKNPLLEGEVWKGVKGYEGYYEISNKGRVKSVTRQVVRHTNGVPHFLTKPSVIKTIHCDTHGYPTVQLSKNGLSTQRVHVLVAKHFLQEPSEKLKREGAVVNHINGDKSDPRVENLEWCNQTHNARQAITAERLVKITGENSVHARLSKFAVLEIVELAKSQFYSQKEIAEKFGMSQITISNILTGRTWASVTGIPKQKRKLKNSKQAIAEQTICH